MGSPDHTSFSRLAACGQRRWAAFTIWTLTVLTRVGAKVNRSAGGWAQEARRIGRCAIPAGNKRRRTTPPRCGNVGQAGMPDTIRITGGSVGARPRRGGFRAAVAVLCVLRCSRAGRCRRLYRLCQPLTSPWPRLAQLGRIEIATLALMLGILCFAVVTAASSCARAGASPRAKLPRTTRPSPSRPKSTA